jgi:hypothetical protein
VTIGEVGGWTIIACVGGIRDMCMEVLVEQISEVMLLSGGAKGR